MWYIIYIYIKKRTRSRPNLLAINKVFVHSSYLGFSPSWIQSSFFVLNFFKQFFHPLLPKPTPPSLEESWGGNGVWIFVLYTQHINTQKKKFTILVGISWVCETQMNMRERGALDLEIACIEGWGNEDMGMGIKSKGGRSGGGFGVPVLCFVNLSGWGYWWGVGRQVSRGYQESLHS